YLQTSKHLNRLKVHGLLLRSGQVSSKQEVIALPAVEKQQTLHGQREKIYPVVSITDVDRCRTGKVAAFDDDQIIAAAGVYAGCASESGIENGDYVAPRSRPQVKLPRNRDILKVDQTVAISGGEIEIIAERDVLEKDQGPTLQIETCRPCHRNLVHRD